MDLVEKYMKMVVHMILDISKMMDYMDKVKEYMLTDSHNKENLKMINSKAEYKYFNQEA